MAPSVSADSLQSTSRVSCAFPVLEDGGDTARREGCMPNHPSLQKVAKSLGTRIRQLRKKKSWSQDELAAICGLHRSHMGKIERGETNVRLSTLMVIAENLDVSVEELLAAAEAGQL